MGIIWTVNLKTASAKRTRNGESMLLALGIASGPTLSSIVALTP